MKYILGITVLIFLCLIGWKLGFNDNVEKIALLILIVFVSKENIIYGIAIAIVYLVYQIGCSKEGFSTALVNESDNIPKIIIQTWKTADIPEKYKPLVESVKRMNPSFEYKFFTDADIVSFLKTNYPEYYTTYLKLPVLIQRIDFFRYIVVYHYGGFYFDLDMTALESLDDNLLTYDSVFPVDEIIKKEMCKQSRYLYFCKNNMYFLLGQYAFGAKPQDPFIKEIIDRIHKDINQTIQLYSLSQNKEIYVYQTTGPDFVSKLYQEYTDKKNVKILHYSNTRQHFGKYAKHNFFGTWK